ncbi:MAG TPA: ERCC4 domain-containing protein [Gemmatimonadales bacterium]|nr:ERCC4 domain-containing protein [Gemmatimonadales bacterium]
MGALWTVERTGHRRFPFRIAVEQDGRRILAVRAQSAWPGPGQQIFCLREHALDPDEPLEPLERVPVAHLGKVGRKLTVVLDRANRKRCEFLAVAKQKNDGTPLEQIFFRTESGIRAHRSRTRMELLPDSQVLTIAIDSGERYPWRFPGAVIRRRRLAAGDYALLDDERPVAVVERKSFDNLLGDFGALQALHHLLEDLASVESSALVIEAQYGDFLDQKRLAGRWPPAHTARVLAELAALHPRLPIVFAGNRKLANVWCHRFFVACRTRESSPQLDLVRETLAGYDPMPREPGFDDRVREEALHRLEPPFGFADLTARFPGEAPARVRRVLHQMLKEGLLAGTGRGRGRRYTRAT